MPPIQVLCGHCSQEIQFNASPSNQEPVLVVQCPLCSGLNEVRVPVESPQNVMSERPNPMLNTASSDFTVLNRRALLIGINYFGSSGELRGCINDVKNMEQLLTETYGWPKSSLRILTDDSSDPGSRPTRSNITQGLHWLAGQRLPGDVLFLHYSGHGAQVEDPNGYEEDGMNETILPGDCNV